MPIERESRHYRTFLVTTSIAVVLCLSVVFLGISIRTRMLIHDALLSRARAHFDSITVIRDWNARYGGVYVEKKSGVTSNPFLRDPDLTAADGRVLTLRNPSVMTREISEITSKRSGFAFHLSSRKPLNPANSPDAFEAEAFDAFDRGSNEFYRGEDRDGRHLFRYMAPLHVSPECLHCHGAQGYRTGDIRGGVGITFDIADVRHAIERNDMAIGIIAVVTIALLAAVIWRFANRLIARIAEVRRAIEEMAVTDGLTRLFNRRYILERFDEEFSRSVRLDEGVACLLIDVDHFKRINDSYGHPAGDAVLQEVATVIRSAVRAYDLVGRFGGEEFLVVLPETDIESARHLAERIRSVVASRKIAVADGGVQVTITVSIGVTTHRKDDLRVDDMITRADEALYAAKNGGRDRVEVRTQGGQQAQTERNSVVDR